MTVGRVFGAMALLTLAEEMKTNPQEDSQPLVKEQKCGLTVVSNTSPSLESVF